MSVVLKSAGDTTFVDCAFINQANLVPILLQWQGDAPPRDSRSKSRYPADASGRSSATDESVAATSAIQELSHDVTFRGCLFQDNRAIENLSYPGIIENTHQSNLVIDNCLFDKNEYDDVENPAPRGYAIRTSGDLSVKNSCFVDNSFRSTAAILSFSDAGVQASMNHVQSRQSTVLQCNFIAAYGSGQMEPVCTPSDVDFCAYEALSTSSPTQSPSETPDETGTDDASKSSSYRARLSMPATCLLIASTLFAANGLVTALLQM
uniref:Right handed beta helix domain-containing protein n=1 Tax=Craspedostauros australis TaxID=1486917 RepID=A0A7R9WUT9_9STRA|mmetsp:Transcript_19584/g.54432  ORF Transcript_19584/g.54432 Transcript_19584/m.54432 type:complete len:264 (+) Transcript_19584:1-792(+)